MGEGAGGPVGNRDDVDRESRSDLRRILYAIDLDPSNKFGSLEEQVFMLARAFKQRGSLFLPLFRYPLGPDAATMYRVENLETGSLDLSRFNAGTLYQLVRLIRRLKIQVVHWNMYHPLNAYLWALTILTPRVEHWMTDHISRHFPIDPGGGAIKNITKRLLLRRYGKVLCVSQFVLRCLESQGTWANLSRCSHFVNTDRFSPDEVERSRVRAAAEANNHFVVLAVAYLLREKGIDVAIRALKELPEHVLLWIVGDGEDAGRLRTLAKELSVETRVRFWGQQRHVQPYMRAADCLVCPSVWAEAAGLVILEALACGLPVVASAVGGIPEFVEDGSNGFLFPAGDPGQLAERLRRLLDDGETLRVMKAAARGMAVERFSIGRRLGEYVDLYRA